MCRLWPAGFTCWTLIHTHKPDSLLAECLTPDWKVVSLNPGRSSGRIFLSVNFVCRLLFGACTTPVLPQWHIKDSGQSVKSAGGRLHLNTHTHLTQWSQSGLTMPLCWHSVGTYQEMSSHTTRQGTLCHRRLSSLSHCRLILAYREELVCAR